MESQEVIAERLARYYHEGQFRKMGADKGKPYIIHPERIAKTLDNSLLRAIAWLHDVLEDCPVTPEMLIKEGIDKDIVDCVKILTRVSGETYLDFILRISKNKDVIPVKIADIEDNMQSLEESSLKDKYRLSLYILRNINK